MNVRSVLPVVLILAMISVAAADEYAAKKHEGLPEGLSPAIAKILDPAGVKVLKGENRSICSVWLAKQWPIKADFKPTSSILYPFEQGELIGAVRFERKWSDFRGREVLKGTYTLRYALQIEDGNHVGTSDTRDFLLLTPAEGDKDPKAIPVKELFKLSAKASGTSHPAIMSLKRAEKGSAEPAVKSEEGKEMVELRVVGKGAAGGKASDLPIELVVIGKGE